MTVKVIGAGFGRTGTMSLKLALEKLGFNRCYHMMEVGRNPGHREVWMAAAAGEPVDWPTVMADYQATVDWPSCNFWREQLAAYPQAKVILSRRDADQWYASVMNTIWKFSSLGMASDDPERRKGAEMAMQVVWQPVFDARLEDKDHVIACYEAHNQQVIDEVPAEQLLVYQPGDGWGPLCEFLQVDVPDGDYPRTNSTEEFLSLWQKPGAAADPD